MVRAGVDVEVSEILDLCRWRQGDGAALRWAEGGVDAAALGDAYDGGDADGASRGGEASAAPCRTLVMRFVRGFKLGDEDAMRQHGGAGQRDGLMRSVVEAFGVQQLLAGCFTGDPHPGNVLLEPVPDASSSEPGATRLRPVLLDFGLAKSLAGDMRVAFSRLVAAASDGDSGHLLDAFDDIGVRLNRENATEDLVMVTCLLRDVQPPTAARAQVMKHRKLIMEQRKKRQSQNKPRFPVDSFPGALLFYLRATEILHGVGSRLGSSLPYLRVMAGYARLALRAHSAGVDTADLLGASGALARGDDATARLRDAVRRIAGVDEADADWAEHEAAAPAAGATTLAELARTLLPPSASPAPPGQDEQDAGDASASVRPGWSATPQLLRRVTAGAGAARREGDGTPVTSAPGSIAGSEAGSSLGGRSLLPAPVAMPACVRRDAPFRGRLEARLHALVTELFLAGSAVGAQVAVFRRARLVTDVGAGGLGPQGPRRVTSSLLFNVVSASKDVMAADSGRS